MGEEVRSSPRPDGIDRGRCIRVEATTTTTTTAQEARTLDPARRGGKGATRDRLGSHADGIPVEEMGAYPSRSFPQSGQSSIREALGDRASQEVVEHSMGPMVISVLPVELRTRRGGNQVGDGAGQTYCACPPTRPQLHSARTPLPRQVHAEHPPETSCRSQARLARQDRIRARIPHREAGPPCHPKILFPTPYPWGSTGPSPTIQFTTPSPNQ